jgi:thiol-disulfide isomerase/thioredoxin
MKEDVFPIEHSLRDNSSRVRWCGLAVVLLGCLGAAGTWLAADETERSGKTAAGQAANDGGAAAADKKEQGADPATEGPVSRISKAPELDGGKGWLNTGGPISIRDLRGKVVLLDFWTYCCINCMHVLPDLKALERKYPKELVVIGVHSAKFDNEKETENIRRAIMRYEIEHPVINDADMVVWRKFHVNAWPSIAVIDPEGYWCGNLSGELGEIREPFEKLLDRIIAFHKAKGTLDESPVHFALEREKVAETPLRFPGKVLADQQGNRLFISDSNHNRIVVTGLDGKLQQIIGSGAIGRADGSFDKASFDHPQGMALAGETLYVADTENHMIRAVDLEQKRVRTMAGTGTQGNDRRIGGDPLQTAINSPWDLVFAKGKLYIAMAGPHQIWTLELGENGRIAPYSGSGREDILNGPLGDAAHAQPSGMTTDGESLFVVDSEGSAVRSVPLDPRGEVATLAGAFDLPRGRSLFEFGDVDGGADKARLQHPLGIVWHQGLLYVADSYNHKIKTVDPKTRETKTFLGDGQPGDRNDPPRFSEPAGLAVAGNTLYVADTNNHRIRTVDLKSGKTASLEIAGLSPPAPASAASSDEDDARRPVAVKPQRIAPGETLNFEVTLNLPPTYKLNPLFPITARVKSAAEQPLVAAGDLNQRQEVAAPEKMGPVKFAVPLAAKSGRAELQVTFNYGYCRDGVGGLCKIGTVTWSIPVEIDAGSKQSAIQLEHSQE